MTIKPGQKARNEAAWKHDGRKLRCKKCGVTMIDREPNWEPGEFVHPANGCPNGGVAYIWELPPDVKVRPHGIERVLPKKYRRARRRGARLASKGRPKL